MLINDQNWLKTWTEQADCGKTKEEIELKLSRKVTENNISEDNNRSQAGNNSSESYYWLWLL